MSVHDNLGKRMKEFNEYIPQTKLMRRVPVAIRIDGKSFHTFAKHFAKPFDEILMASMQETMKYLCENIQGCVFGYTQSDEITLILIDYQKFTSSAWFDYEIQKLCSISASMATMAFNKFFAVNAHAVISPDENTFYAYLDAIEKGAMFDARCFNIPKEEVANLIYWRQLDATRNSIQMVGQANFSHKELHGKSCNKIQDMLFTEKGINWNDYPIPCKRGTACYKNKYILNCKEESEWIIDKEMPILKDDWDYVNKHIYVGEE